MKVKKNKTGVLNARSKVEKIFYGFMFVLFALYGITMLYPFVWTFLSSVKPFAEYQLDMMHGRAFALPKTWRFQNYVDAFSMIETSDGVNFLGMLFNNIWQAVLPLFLGTLTQTLFAYVMSRFEFKGRGLIYAVIIFTMTIPIMGSNGAYFKLICDLGLYDNPLLKIATSVGFGGMGFLVYYGFFKNVPYSYAEAVYMDGGGEFTVFFRVILPQAKPIIVMFTIQSLIGNWNDYMGPLLYLPSYPTVASGMYLVRVTLIRTGKNSIYYAGLLVTTIPSLVLFISFSDLIMENMSIGGLKG